MNNLIKKLRIRRDITQKEVAQNVGIQQSTISRMEKNCDNVSWKLILKVLIYLKADSNEINKFLSNYSNIKYHYFFNMLIEDENIRNNIIKDPLLCIDKFKKSLYVNI